MDKDKNVDNKTHYIGVRNNRSGRFSAKIADKSSKRGQVWLGTFDTAEEAARTYDRAAYLMRGSHAVLNFPDEMHLYAADASASSSRNETEKEEKEVIEFEYLDDKILEDMLEAAEKENKRAKILEDMLEAAEEENKSKNKKDKSNAED